MSPDQNYPNGSGGDAYDPHDPPPTPQPPYGAPFPPHHPPPPYYPHEQYGYPPPGYMPWGPLPHSGLGIASSVLGAIALLGLCMVMGMVGATYGDDPTALERAAEQQAPEAVAIGLGMCAAILALLIGAILGIIGLCQSTRRKTFAWVGLSINGLIILGFCALAAVGQVVQG